MDPQLIEQLACYLWDRHKATYDVEFPDKDELAGWIADFLTESGIPHKDALTARLKEIKPPIERPEGWIPYDYFGGNMDDAYDGGLTDGERYLAAELRELLGIDNGSN